MKTLGKADDAQIIAKQATRQASILLLAAFSIVIAQGVIFGLNASKWSEFLPLNGTFQNYNPWRRMLDGQAVFSGFAAYLGAGHYLWGGVFTALIGGTYADSLFVGSFLTFVISCASIFAVCRLILKSNTTAASSMLAIAFGWMLFPDLFKLLYAPLNYSLNLASVGNSARILRGFGIIQFVILLAIANTVIKRFVAHEKREWAMFLSAAALAGLTLSYSNDSGIASYASASICVLIYTLRSVKDVRKIFIRAGIWIGLSVGTFFVTITLLTGFHPVSYIQSALGTASYQLWYYDAPKPYYLYDVFNSFTFTDFLTVGLAALNIVWFVKHNKIENLLLAFVLLAGLIVNKQYFIGSNIYGNYDLETLFIQATIIAYVIKLLMHLDGFANNKTVQLSCAVVILCVCVCFTAVNAIAIGASYRSANSDADSSNIPELGGYLSRWSSDLYALSEHIGGDTFWSTYASAFETIQGKFQPSGYDYIIHVLGADARQKYLDVFHEVQPQHVLNPTFETQDYMPWVRSANWFFFRELYANYDISEYIGYLENWVRSETPNLLTNEARVSVTVNEDNTVKISVTTDKGISAVADVAVSFDTQTVDKPSAAILHRVVWVNDVTFAQQHPNTHTTYSLPDSVDNWYFPITIVDGYGEIILTAEPAKDTALHVTSADIVQLLKDPYNRSDRAIPTYVSSDRQLPTQVLQLTDNNWTNGVSNFDDGNILLFSTMDAAAILDKKPTVLVMDGVAYPIVSIEKDGSGFVRMTMQDHETALKFAYPAYFEMQYETAE